MHGVPDQVTCTYIIIITIIIVVVVVVGISPFI